MKLSDEKRIEAPRDVVWAGLNDPDILKQSIPGCDTLTQLSDTEFEAEVRAKIGPVKAKFKGSVQLPDLTPPVSYRISGEGKGGAAGFAKGGATVTLSEDGDATILKYDVDADVGGKLAQIGGRLIEGSAKKLAGEFFNNFEAALKAGEAGNADAIEAAAMPEAAAAPTPVSDDSMKKRVWLIVGVVFVVGALALTLLK